MIESNVIYNFEDFRALITEKAKEGAYYLVYDDFYFEQIGKDTMITREVYSVVNRYTRSSNIIKYMNFKVKDNYTTKEIAELVELLKQQTKIFLTIFNPKKKDCFLLFKSTKNDSKLEDGIKNLLETLNIR